MQILTVNESKDMLVLKHKTNVDYTLIEILRMKCLLFTNDAEFHYVFQQYCTIQECDDLDLYMR